MSTPLEGLLDLASGSCPGGHAAWTQAMEPVPQWDQNLVMITSYLVLRCYNQMMHDNVTLFWAVWNHSLAAKAAVLHGAC